MPKGLTRLVFLAPLGRESDEVAGFLATLERAGVRVLGDLATPRRRIGTVMLSGKIGQIRLDKAELDLLDSLLHQAAIALETSLLLEERMPLMRAQRQTTPGQSCSLRRSGCSKSKRPARIMSRL